QRDLEDPIDTETPESSLAIAPPIPLSESTPPVLVPILRKTPFVSPPDLPSQKRYHGTSNLVEDSEEDDDEEDEEIEESMDSDSVSEDAKDEGPTAKDEDHAMEDEGLTAGVEGPNMYDEGYGLDDESRGIDDEGHSVESDGLGLEEEEAVPGATPTTIEAEGFLTKLGAQVEMQGGLIRDHAVRLEELSLALFKRYDRDIGELFIWSGAVREDIFSQRYRFRSLE
ncbi:hypothetical protein Tco_1488794, partial [Tanacetum coccineum]